MTTNDANEMVRLTSAANPFEAHDWEHALKDEGIRCQVLGDYLGGGLGNIPGMMAEVWVLAADLERAEAILREYEDRTEEVAQPDETR